MSDQKASSLWALWAAVEERRGSVLALIEEHRAAAGPAHVRWGRRIFMTAEQIQGVAPPGWASLDSAAMDRHRTTVSQLLHDLSVAQARARRGDLERRADRLAEEAQGLAAAIRRAPVTSMSDVVAKLDVIAAMWGAAGDIAEPGAPLAELLALIEELLRESPGVMPTWVRRRRALTAVEAPRRKRPEYERAGSCPHTVPARGVTGRNEAASAESIACGCPAPSTLARGRPAPTRAR